MDAVCARIAIGEVLEDPLFQRRTSSHLAAALVEPDQIAVEPAVEQEARRVRRQPTGRLLGITDRARQITE